MKRLFALLLCLMTLLSLAACAAAPADTTAPSTEPETQPTEPVDDYDYPEIKDKLTWEQKIGVSGDGFVADFVFQRDDAAGGILHHAEGTAQTDIHTGRLNLLIRNGRNLQRTCCQHLPDRTVG